MKLNELHTSCIEIVGRRPRSVSAITALLDALEYLPFEEWHFFFFKRDLFVPRIKALITNWKEEPMI